jgi:hypothetical protein
MKEKLKEANYEYKKYLGNKSHLLWNVSTDKFEVFFSNNHHASWGLIWKNTHLEFAYSLNKLIQPQRQTNGRLRTLLPDGNIHCQDYRGAGGNR